MKKDEYKKFLEAVDLVCINCAEDTLDNPDVCDSCPVRKTYKMVEREQHWQSSEKAANDFYDWLIDREYYTEDDKVVDIADMVKDFEVMQKEIPRMYNLIRNLFVL